MSSEQEIRLLLQKFQDGYTRRAVSNLDAFMELFTPDTEVIGTSGYKPGEREWLTNREAARKLVKGDWERWGDLRLDVDSARIHMQDGVGWITATATVSKIIGDENYAELLQYIKEYIETSKLPAEQKLHYILRDGTNTIYELRRGDHFIWPLRFTAVVLHDVNGWRFTQVHFSFPTIGDPDVRIVDQEA
jgi:hypothetical protein